MIVLDTHILIWWLSGCHKLSTAARNAIEQEQKNNGCLIVSTITSWEIAMLVNRGRLNLTMDLDSWLGFAQQVDSLHFEPLSNKVAIESTRLPGQFHKDPADRIIVALSRSLAAPLVTADEKILTYSHVKTISQEAVRE
ncbi:type II toxin-antitoxin system VapC family toxin [Salinisphaera sp. G21_0]|uniref:type II toxin-antitoxin system VapC family toxin n=1 Tax=Salinisphaera sp. G21_0 TaxID=2821094 RepID=UPI001ADCA4D6|nr:type II toxin-antitoxin system VapC family toxin [Salinisphaera sp. G21_0]MBO9483688.1 type II toxin-antitoxin system VapC family toxin [Salinisphaera sp. G21_0]